MQIISRSIILSCIIILGGCAWFGVETLNPTEIDIKSVYVREIKPTNDFFKKIDIGATLGEVTTILGDPKSIQTENETTLYIYPSNKKIKSGAVACLGLIPIPARTEKDGEYHFYFTNNKLSRITSLETKASFHGVYIDDSGSGMSNGEKSKCNI